MSRFGLRLARFGQLARFYQAALINTAFGYGSYALLVRIGVDRFVASTIAQVLGVTFNYFTYSRHVFRQDGPGTRGRFVLAYTVNYGISLGLLALISLGIRSPYLAGAVATIIASLINYFALKHVVFVRRDA